MSRVVATMLTTAGAWAVAEGDVDVDGLTGMPLTASSCAAGDFMANWATQQEGKRIGSDASGHSQTECWDLAMAAIEQARKNGYTVETAKPSNYVWSSQVKSVQNAEPGDILQFASYSEKYCSGGSCHTKYTGSHHTAVVTRAFDSATCGITVEEQNPDPVHQSVYHPCSQYQTAGSLIVYGMCSGGSPSPSPAPAPTPSPTGCSDQPVGWMSYEGESCNDYVSWRYCTADGKEGSGWQSSWGHITDYPDSNGVTADQACCGCGGGSAGIVV